MSKKQFGFGIIGTGMIAHFHARAIAEIENAILVGVYNQTKLKADEFSKQYQCKSYDSLKELLENKEIDIVCICTPSGAHLEPALMSIAAGKHCLIEKPLEISLERCDEIIKAAKKRGVKISVIFPSRFNEASGMLKKAIEENRFNRLVLGDAYVKWYRTPQYYQSGKWRGTWKLDGGGALMNQGIHAVDLLQWYMGEVKAVQAFATNAKHKDIEVEDTIVASIQFANGALGTIECSTAVFPGDIKRIEIRGTEGSAILEEDRLIRWEFKEKRESDKELMRKIDSKNTLLGGSSDPAAISFKGHQMQIEDMMNAILSRRNPVISVEEGKKSVAIIEAIYKSAETGEKEFLR